MESTSSPQMLYMATRNGLEPSTSSVTGWRANRLHHRAKLCGGNNRARTCDLLLVRQMLSQLSYAPVCFGVLLTSATWFIIHKRGPFVKHFFQNFLSNFSESFSLSFPTSFGENQIFFSNSRISSGVNSYTVSQNWHSTGKDFSSSRISCSSLRPRLISAEVTRSREQ